MNIFRPIFFIATTLLFFVFVVVVGAEESKPQIVLDKTVRLGPREGATCNQGVKEVQSVYGASITYAFVITNTGNTCLSNVVLRDDGLNYVNAFPGIMQIGSEYRKCFQTIIEGDAKSTAYVYGNPVDCETGSDLVPAVEDVSWSNTASVKEMNAKPNCSTKRDITDLTNGRFLVTTTETCKQCDCPN